MSAVNGILVTQHGKMFCTFADMDTALGFIRANSEHTIRLTVGATGMPRTIFEEYIPATLEGLNALAIPAVEYRQIETVI